MSNFLPPCGLQHARLSCPSLSPGVCSNSCPLSQWCHPTASFSVASFFSCFQSFPASESFPMSWLFISIVYIVPIYRKFEDYCNLDNINLMNNALTQVQLQITSSCDGLLLNLSKLTTWWLWHSPSWSIQCLLEWQGLFYK